MRGEGPRRGSTHGELRCDRPIFRCIKAECSASVNQYQLGSRYWYNTVYCGVIVYLVRRRSNSSTMRMVNIKRNHKSSKVQFAFLALFVMSVPFLTPCSVLLFAVRTSLSRRVRGNGPLCCHRSEGGCSCTSCRGGQDCGEAWLTSG